MQNLNNQISTALCEHSFKIESTHNISVNLNSKWELRPYQKEAFARFDYYTSKFQSKKTPSHLLFHMATGSGKTLVMAGLILNLYESGYRNFIFFVHNRNIIEKTRDNFLNNLSSKYLFADQIDFNDKKIEIAEVENFEATNKDDINIVFTTIQGLHLKMNSPKENSITYEDFEEQKVVLISDEAHHINADTKKGKLTKDEEEAILSWEATVNKIFKSNKENFLIEFTATADLENLNIKEKYENKLIFDYPLKQFRIDKYSKEVNLLQSNLEPFERALQAVILSQYRRKIFQDFAKNIKPVTLLKSKTIDESLAFFEEFVLKIKGLKESDLENIKIKNGTGIFKTIFEYLEKNNISLENFLLEIKEDFDKNKCISINSKNDSNEKQLIINSLEDINNEIRVVFAVDKLNEGWDVLNLFDIVRLYNTRDGDHKSGKIGKTTMSEAQLIGRGARYCPFQIDKMQPLYQRKFDEDLGNSLRICEELYYHSAHNPTYISELNKALEEIGLKESKIIEHNIKLKDRFKETEFYKSGVIYLNARETDDRSNIFELPKELRVKIFKVKFSHGYSTNSRIFEKTSLTKNKIATKTYHILDFGIVVIRKALNKLPFYHFDNLQKHFPHLSSINDFINSPSFLKGIIVEIEADYDFANNPDKEVQLKVIVAVLKEIEEFILKSVVEFRGSYEFKANKISDIFRDKTMSYSVNANVAKNVEKQKTSTNKLDLIEGFYPFDSQKIASQDEYLLNLLKQSYKSLQKSYANIYLFKNHNHFKLYNFEDGKSLNPDFVCFLIEKNKKDSKLFQIFIIIEEKNQKNTEIYTKQFFRKIESEAKIGVTEGTQNYKIQCIFINEEQKTGNSFDKFLKELKKKQEL
ncbi:DEAD/DEAH box helicase family protein [Halpernia sp. GG3]